MLEWNTFIKPIIYVVELIFATVVTISTADKLLFYDDNTTAIRCGFGDNIGACASVISIGSLCMIGGMYVLWKRLSSAFLSDMKYRNDTESVMCFFLSLGWLIIAAVATAFATELPGTPDGFLRAERRVAITFAWLLWAFHIGSMAIAWFAPDEDDKSERFEPLNPDNFPGNDAFDIQLDTAPPGLQAWPPLASPEIGPTPDVADSGSSLQTPITPLATDIDRFLHQHDSITEAHNSHAMDVDSGSPMFGDMGPSPNQLERRETIQDVASAWQDIVTADLETEMPDFEVTQTVSERAEPGDSANTIDRRSARSSTAGLSEPGTQPGLEARATLRRRGRTVRFGDDPPGSR